MRRSDADDALETALHILEALQKARDAQAIAEEAISKAQGQITDIETSLDNVSTSNFSSPYTVPCLVRLVKDPVL